MPATTLQAFLEHLRILTDPNRSRELSDADLLERFRTQREEAAFTLLVQRHGPMVLTLCRRILGNGHEAEDVFQAAFLVLVRKAATIRQDESLAGWLHRVASRLALKTRAQAARRHKSERDGASKILSEECRETLIAEELRAALDEEIERLPEKYRMPVVLCYLTDKTHEQAARDLGCPKSSVTSRLVKARQLLQQRLIRRGFTAPAGLVAMLLTEAVASAALPSVLALSTVRLAMSALLGKPLAATATVALADSVAKGSALTKWLAGISLLAALSVAAIGPLCMNTDSPTAKPAPSAKPQQAATKAEPRKPRLDWQGDPLPDGVLARMGSGRFRQAGFHNKLMYSADGKWLVAATKSGIPRSHAPAWERASGRSASRVSRRRAAGPAFPRRSVGSRSSYPSTGRTPPSVRSSKNCWSKPRLPAL